MRHQTSSFSYFLCWQARIIIFTRGKIFVTAHLLISLLGYRFTLYCIFLSTPTTKSVNKTTFVMWSHNLNATTHLELPTICRSWDFQGRISMLLGPHVQAGSDKISTLSTRYSLRSREPKRELVIFPLGKTKIHVKKLLLEKVSC